MTSIIENNINNDDENLCFYCCDKKNMNNFNCGICHNSLCALCFNKMSDDKYDIEKFENINMKLKCPICRDEKIYTYENFEKEDIITIANLHIKQIIKQYQNGDIKQRIEPYRNKVLELNKEIEKYKEQLEELNKTYKKQLEDKDEIHKLKLEDKEEIHKLKLEEKEEIHKQHLLLFSKYMMNQSNNLKFICERDKTKTINKQLLKPLYEGVAEISLKI